MLLANRPRLAQTSLVVVIAAMTLPWASAVTGTSDSPLRGYQVGEGQLVVLVALAAIAAIQLEWRPAWIGAGLIVATLVRSFLDFGDTEASAGLGIWIGVAAGVSALVILVWNMFSEVAANAPVSEVTS